MPNELSLVSLVLCVATGVLFCILLFILAKRKITRFTLKTSRRAHETIGAGSPKELRQEILRRLELTKNIKFEPHLIHDRCEAKPDSLKDLGVTCNYKYRMLAVDAFSSIDVTLAKLSPGHQPRHPNMSVRGYLLSLHHKGPLLGASLKLMNAYADAYEHARHSPKEFGQDEYKAYIELLQQIISCLQSESPMMSTNSREKVDVEVFYTDDHQYASSVQTKAVTVASDSPKSPRVLYGLQTRLRGSASKQSSAGDQQALLGSISSARSSEGHSDHDDSSDRLIPPGTESNC